MRGAHRKPRPPILGSPTFWRVYVGSLLAAALAMRLTGWQLPSSVRQVGLSTTVGIMGWDAGVKWQRERFRGAHRAG